MPALTTFTDFMKNTGPAYATGPNEFVNEALRNTYTLKYMCQGRGKKEIIRGGSSIKDNIMFDDGSTAEWYTPGQSKTYLQPQVLTAHEENWRFIRDYESWVEEVIDLNVGAGMTSNARAQKYKDEKRKIGQRAFTSLLNHIETSYLWGAAHGNTADMEAAAGTRAYSIPVFVNENTNTVPNGWTTIAGISPATETRWQNQAIQYSYTDPNDAGQIGIGLIERMEAMKLATKFDSVPLPEIDPSTTNNSNRTIFTSALGMRLYKRVLRANNDALVYSEQDGSYPTPTFDGIPVVHIDYLGSAGLYYDGSVYTAAETAAQNAGPRFYFIDSQYLFPVFHETGYYKVDGEPKSDIAQPGVWVRNIRMYTNLFCRSRRRQGILYPGAVA